MLVEQDETWGVAVEIDECVFALFTAGKSELQGECALFVRRTMRKQPMGLASRLFPCLVRKRCTKPEAGVPLGRSTALPMPRRVGSSQMSSTMRSP